MVKKAKLGSPEPFQLINKIPIVDNGEPLIDLRNRRDTRFVVLAPGCLPYVRESILGMLIKAQSHLPWQYHLRISTALRTLDMQSRMYWSNFERIQKEHPQWPLSSVRRACNKFFAPPDTKAPPGHCTGGAVDLTLVDLTGKPLDMTSPLQRWEGAYTHVEGLSAQAQSNRDMLCDAMLRAGFSNCRDEWWHWSYGDSAWAVRTGANQACYGLIEPPIDYAHIPRRVRPRSGPSSPAAGRVETAG